jgi:hypothetical protein
MRCETGGLSPHSSYDLAVRAGMELLDLEITSDARALQPQLFAHFHIIDQF